MDISNNELVMQYIAEHFDGLKIQSRDLNTIQYQALWQLKKEKVLLPDNEKEAREFLNIIMDKDFFSNLLAGCLKEYDNDTKHLYHVGRLKKMIEKGFHIKIDGTAIGLTANFDAEKVRCSCGEMPALVKKSDVLGGISDEMIYYCSKCGAYVGVHKETNIPLGKPADEETRTLRRKCHEVFDKRWETQQERSAAYDRLAKKLNISKAEAHFGMFDKEMCEKALELMI